MNTHEQVTKKKLSAAMSHALLVLGVSDGLAIVVAALSAMVAVAFKLTDKQMIDLNAAMATIIGQHVRRARGKAIEA